jgi:hypothetical protein
MARSKGGTFESVPRRVYLDAKIIISSPKRQWNIFLFSILCQPEYFHSCTVAICRDLAGRLDDVTHTETGRGYDKITIAGKESRRAGSTKATARTGPTNGRGAGTARLATSAFRLVELQTDRVERISSRCFILLTPTLGAIVPRCGIFCMEGWRPDDQSEKRFTYEA